jgi:hypothetical protein
MRIDSSGNVGISTGGTAAASKLDVYGVGNFQGLEVGKSGQTGNRNAGIDFTGDETYTDFGLRIIRDNVGANANNTIQTRGTGQLALFTQEAGPIVMSTTSTERLRIDSSGRVGIGTTNPIQKLQVRDGTNRNFSVVSDVNYSNAGGIAIISTDDANTAYAPLSVACSPLILNAAGGSGNVGIGTTSPAAKLDTDGCIRSTGQNVPASGAGAEIVYASNTAAFYGYDRTNGTFTNTVFDGQNVTTRTNSVDRITVNSSGNVSIGTATALSTLHVHGNVTLSNTTTATSAGTGGLSKPATYAGYLTVSINGTSRKIPYYAT